MGLGLQFHKFGLLFLVKVSRKLRLFWKLSFYDTEATRGAYEILEVACGCNTQETDRLFFFPPECEKFKGSPQSKVTAHGRIYACRHTRMSTQTHKHHEASSILLRRASMIY